MRLNQGSETEKCELLQKVFTVREGVYLKLWVKGEEEGLSCAIEAVADFKGFGCQRTKHLETKQQKTTRVAAQQHIKLHDGHVDRTPAYLAVAVLNDQEHRGVLALHGSVQGLNAHAVL